MTQPIQEPTLQRTDARLTWGSNQLFRRPSPVSGAADLPYIWMNWNGPRTVPVDTLSNPATMGVAPDVPYEDFCSHDPDNIASWSWDMSSGCIGWFEPGEYLITVWAAYDGGATAGSTLAVVLDKGSSCSFSSFGRTTSMIVADAINEGMRITLTESFYWPTAGDASFRIVVYHNDAGGQDLNGCQIHIVQINSIIECTDSG